ncbi:hypothetical protein L2E82_29650 [Cichorium intybus]|uniref:Uncharacterized protein n=1 Tax=Cichorium intybus TaxID=13427 RepID=A0ACB9CYF1_CICIN|nr:hypothetical protein L2E82_29650 [Cichorium intybus]
MGSASLGRRGLRGCSKKMAHQGILGAMTENPLPGVAAGLIAGRSSDSSESQDYGGIGLVTKGQHRKSDSSGKPPSRIDKSKLKCSHCAEKGKAAMGAGTNENQTERGFGGIATAGVKDNEGNAGKGFEALSSDPCLLNPKFFSPQILEMLQDEPQTTRHANIAQNSHKAHNNDWILDSGATETMTFESSDITLSS